MVNMTSVSASSKRSQKLQSSSGHHRSSSLDQIHAANRNAVLMDEDSDEDEDIQYADQEVLYRPDDSIVFQGLCSFMLTFELTCTGISIY